MGSSYPPSLSNVAPPPPPKKTGAQNTVFTHFAQNFLFFFFGGGGGGRVNITFEFHCSSEARAYSCNLKVHRLPLQRKTHWNFFSHDLGTARILRTMANPSVHRHLLSQARSSLRMLRLYLGGKAIQMLFLGLY